jgi:cystathionine gamma-synthase
VSPASLDRSATWPYEDGDPGRFHYARYGHPTGAAAEEALGRLDGGQALLFASGSAAETAVLLGLLDPGATVAVAQGCYFGTFTLMRMLERWGLRAVEFDQTGHPPDGVDLIWLEAPANPMLSFPDLDAAAQHPARVLVDATASSPVLLRPLEHGADFVLHSATKYLGGHADILLGVVVCRDEADHERLLEFRTKTGIGAAADPAWLLLRSLETLEVRVRRQSERVEAVRYPGLGDPRAERWLRGGFGGLLSFDVAGGGDAARRVEQSTRLITNATSLGGVRSTMESRYRWEPDRVPPGLLRLSVGLEDADALWADLDQALGH